MTGVLDKAPIERLPGVRGRGTGHLLIIFRYSSGGRQDIQRTTLSSEREQATQNLNEAHPSITSLTNANQNCVLGTDVAEKYRTHVTSGVRIIAEGYSYIIRTLPNTV